MDPQSTICSGAYFRIVPTKISTLELDTDGKRSQELVFWKGKKKITFSQKNKTFLEAFLNIFKMVQNFPCFVSHIP